MGYSITGHAWSRYAERGGSGDLREEVKQSCDFGVQLGDSFMRQLPCGLVAVGRYVIQHGCYLKVITTVLTADQACVNVQAIGLLRATYNGKVLGIRQESRRTISRRKDREQKQSEQVPSPHKRHLPVQQRRQRFDTRTLLKDVD